jgi:signal transduction histidine kinase
MTFPQLIPLAAAICNLCVTLFVCSRGMRSTLSRVFLLWGLSIMVWNFGTYFLFVLGNQPENHHAALMWARFLQMGVIFIPVSLFHLTLLIAQIQVKKYIYLVYLFGVILALTNFTDFFIPDVRYVGYAWYSKAGLGFYLFSLSYTLTFISIIILFRKRRELPALHRTRLNYLIVAQTTLVTLGTNDILPILGVDRYPIIGGRIFPVGSMAAIFYGLLVAYSVLQHQLLDIHVTLGKIAANLVRVLLLALFGLLLLLIVAFSAPAGKFPPFAFFSALGVVLVCIVAGAIFFPRLFGRGDDRLERKLLGDRFEYHDKIHGFIQSVPWYSDTTLLLDDLHDLFLMTMRMRSYQIVLLDETARAFSLLRSYPEEPPGPVADLQRDAPVFQYFHTTKADYLTMNDSYLNPGNPGLVKAAQQQLKRFNPAFCFPFLSDEDPIGLLLIGQKTNGDPYTPHDLHLLTSLMKNLDSIINQIRLKQKVLVSEEMELLGRMSRGMAHDLNNLITPVWTYLQLVNEKPPEDEIMSELVSTATRNVEALRQYVKESLFYSTTMTPHFLPGRLDLTLIKAIELVQPRLSQKGITIDHPELPPVEVEMDVVLIQRLLCNLFINASDASPAGSKIHAQIRSLAKTEAGRNWFRVQVIDHGEGIKPEHLRLIFRPYFTTKDRGGEQRGFGLGLAICRKIVHLHGGNLNLASEANKGTTVLVDLPSHQSRKPAGKPNPMVAMTS